VLLYERERREIMDSGEEGIDLGKAVQPIIRKFLENIESPFVVTPIHYMEKGVSSC